MTDFSNLSNEELLKIAGEAPSAPAQPAVPELSNNELLAIASQNDGPRSRIAEALRSGLTSTITANVYTGLREQAKDKLNIHLPDIVGPARPAPGYEPEGFAEKTVAFAGSMLDPALGPVFGLAGKLAKPLLIGEEALKRSLQLRILNRAVQGGIGFGAVGGAAKSAEQFAKGTFEPGQIAANALIGAGLGATLNQALGPLGDAIKRSQERRAGRAAEIFEKPSRAPGPLADRATANEAANIHSKLVPIENKIKGVEKVLKSTTLSPQEEQTIAFKRFHFEYEQNRLLKEYKDTIQGPEFKAFQQARDRFANKKDASGNPIWQKAITPRNVILEPEELNSFYAIKSDITPRQAGSLGFQDPARIAEGIEGRRGVIKTRILEPVAQANVKRAEAEQALRAQIVKVANELPDKSKERLEFLFRVGENRATDAEKVSLAPAEQDFLNYTAKTYSDLLTKINQVNTSLNLPLVRRREDYLTHLQKLSFFSKYGINVSPGQRVRTAFRFERERLGEEFEQDPVKALEAYVGPATRRIYMQQAASEAQARVNALPPNLRRYYTEWIQGPVMGGIDPKDASFLNNGWQGALKIAENISGALTRSVILGNLNVAVQQPSQTVSTAVLTNVGSALRGMKLAASGIPKELANRSAILKPRTLLDELPQFKPAVMKNFQKFAGAIQTAADKYVFNSSWASGYLYGKDKLFLSDEAAIRFADDIAVRLHGAYGDIFKPPVLRGRVGKAFLPFQTFSFNLYNHITKDPRVLAELSGRGKVTEFFKAVGAMAGTNQLYKALGMPEPFSVTSSIPLLGSAKFGIPSPPLEFVAKEVKGVLSEKEADQRASILGNLFLVAFSEDAEDREKALVNLTKVGSRFVPMGTQIKNSIEGILAAQDGYWSVGREVVDLDELDKMVAVALGPGKTPAARAFFRRAEARKSFTDRALRLLPFNQ